MSTPPIAWPNVPSALVTWTRAEIGADTSDADTYANLFPVEREKVKIRPSISGFVVYTTNGGDKITVKLRDINCVVISGQLVTEEEGLPVFVAATNNPKMSAQGWTYSLVGYPTIKFPAPTGATVDLSNHVLAPAIDATKYWVDRIPELVGILEDYLIINPPGGGGVTYDKGILDQSVNLDTVTVPGVYSLRYNGTPGENGDTDTARAGSLMVLDTRNPSGNMKIQVRFEDGEVVSVRSQNSAGQMQRWRTLAHDLPDKPTTAASRRPAVVAGGLARRDGVVGTGGRPAIALRFDHHTRPFIDKILPLLKQHQLPWGQMLNASSLGTTGNEAGTAAEMQTACLASGGEAWNHSWSHVDVINGPQAEREITRGLTDLRAAMPRLWIDGFAPPGASSYMGLEGFDATDKWWSTDPGRRVLAQHAFVRGYHSPVHRALNGPDLIGAGHITIDKQTQAYCESAIRWAALAGAGLTLMLHPNYLDTTGFMSTSTLSSILAHIASRRDAGEIEVLTPTAIMMADSSRPRHSILEGAIEAGTIPAGGWSETIGERTNRRTLGVPHELGATLTGTGNATLTITITTPSGTITSTRTRALTATPVRHAVVATAPLDTTGITVSIAAPAARHLGITYRPI